MKGSIPGALIASQARETVEIEELTFDEQKTHQDPRRATKPAQLRSETPAGVIQEVYFYCFVGLTRYKGTWDTLFHHRCFSEGSLSWIGDSTPA